MKKTPVGNDAAEIALVGRRIAATLIDGTIGPEVAMNILSVAVGHIIVATRMPIERDEAGIQLFTDVVRLVLVDLRATTEGAPN